MQLQVEWLFLHLSEARKCPGRSRSVNIPGLCSESFRQWPIRATANSSPVDEA